MTRPWTWKYSRNLFLLLTVVAAYFSTPDGMLAAEMFVVEFVVEFAVEVFEVFVVVDVAAAVVVETILPVFTPVIPTNTLISLGM